MEARPMTREEAARLRFTGHALKAMRSRHVEVEDVVEALLRPEVVEPHASRVRFVREGVAYVVAEEQGRPILITVLLRRRDEWTNADARGR